MVSRLFSINASGVVRCVTIGAFSLQRIDFMLRRTSEGPCRSCSSRSCQRSTTIYKTTGTVRTLKSSAGIQAVGRAWGRPGTGRNPCFYSRKRSIKFVSGRNKQMMGLGSLFGEGDLLQLDGDPAKERQVVDKQVTALWEIL